MEEIYFKLPKYARYMLALRLLVAGLGNLASLSSDEIEDLKLAVSEACFNFAGEGELLEFVFSLADRQVGVQLSGPAARRSVLSLPNPADDGVSMLLMRNLMDSVEFRTDREGTSIRMIKRAQSSVAAGRR